MPPSSTAATDSLTARLRTLWPLRLAAFGSTGGHRAGVGPAGVGARRGGPRGHRVALAVRSIGSAAASPESPADAGLAPGRAGAGHGHHGHATDHGAGCGAGGRQRVDRHGRRATCRCRLGRSDGACRSGRLRRRRRVLGFHHRGVRAQAGGHRQCPHLGVATDQRDAQVAAARLACQQAEVDATGADAGAGWDDQHDVVIRGSPEPGDRIGDLVIQIEIPNAHVAASLT